MSGKSSKETPKEKPKKKHTYLILAIIILVLLIGFVVVSGNAIEGCFNESGNDYADSGNWCANGCDSGYGNWSGS